MPTEAEKSCLLCSFSQRFSCKSSKAISESLLSTKKHLVQLIEQKNSFLSRITFLKLFIICRHNADIMNVDKLRIITTEKSARTLRALDCICSTSIFCCLCLSILKLISGKISVQGFECAWKCFIAVTSWRSFSSFNFLSWETSMKPLLNKAINKKRAAHSYSLFLLRLFIQMLLLPRMFPFAFPCLREGRKHYEIISFLPKATAAQMKHICGQCWQR